MPQVFKANPAYIAKGTLYSTLQLKVFKIAYSTITDVDSGQTDHTAPGTYSDGLYSKATSLAQEFGTTGALFQVKSDGTSMVFVGDGHALDIDIVAVRADKALGGAGTLTGSGTTSTVTVTQLTSLYGIS
jgi:hypothetical protein